MRQLKVISLLLILASAAAGHAAAQTAQTPPDTIFEMPGVFRIALAQGWQRSRAIDDRQTVAAFSNKDLTLEVMRELVDTPVEVYAQDISDRGQDTEWDEYPGKYLPQEFLTSGDRAIANRFDEYAPLGGVPAQWVRYRLEYKTPSEELLVARVWTVFVLSPGQYWGLALRGDDRSWPSTDDVVQRMVRSFQFLEPTLSRVKAAIPQEAWKRMPSSLPAGSCQFTGIASGLGVVVPCDTKVTSRRQGEADKDGIVGEEQLQLSASAFLILRRYVGNWSAEDFSQRQEQAYADEMKAAPVDGHKQGYHRDDKREVVVDGIPGTSITATMLVKKSNKKGIRQLLTASKGSNHFSIRFYYTDKEIDQIAQISASVHLFALRPELSNRDHTMAGMLQELQGKVQRSGGNISGLFNGPEANPAPPSAHEMERIREDVRLFKDSGSHYRLGRALDASGDHAAAFTEFETAVLLNPRNAEADREIARIYTAQNDLPRAIAAYQRVLEYSEADTDAHEQLAALYAKSGNTLFAVFHLSLAGESASEPTLPVHEIAPAQKLLADSEDQIVAVTDQFGKDPVLQNRISSLLLRADLEAKCGNFAYAAHDCRLVHRVDPHNLHALACLVRTADAGGEQDAIVGYAKEWLALSPNNPEAYYWQARGYSWPPANYVKAAESFDAVIRNAGQGQIASNMLRVAHLALPFDYEKLQMWQNAAAAYDSGVRELPADAQVLNNAAWFFATTEKAFRNPTKALEYANRACAAAPGDANIMGTLAEAYFVNGRINDAVATEQKALALDPEQADLQKQMERFKKAKKTEPGHRK